MPVLLCWVDCDRAFIHANKYYSGCYLPDNPKILCVRNPIESRPRAVFCCVRTMVGGQHTYVPAKGAPTDVRYLLV